MNLPKLNFENTFDLEIRTDKDKFFIYDLARKSWLLLTPEEWVRQHWLHYFHIIKGRNLSSLILEKKLVLNGTTKRIDLLVTEKTVAKILVECKAPHIKLTEKTFEQTARYNSIIGAEEIILSNGIQHIFAKFADNHYQFLPATF
ncbi:hypothetical protein OA84_06955 [Kaistella solincola]|uniref:Type I restriction enzyme R protein N-terminal domain-containing protein n=1 Tax=Kaistella solincola TaxID=510955 RepID=A0ABR4ZR97_9FLAO|nr:type I restriction enzyme HsdR N-terminal domain-containing protein [Kaistella solincola]KIA83274.1 hypothetical protein OA84_06955 [Kaistella solincola]